VYNQRDELIIFIDYGEKPKGVFFMGEIILKAMARSEKPKKVRNAGFIPGVLNGPGTSSTSVQFETVSLNKIIARHGTNAKLWVLLGAEKKFGFIKEIQKHPVEDKVIHIAIQLVSKDQASKMKLPITFHGHVELEQRFLQVQVYKSEVEVEGKAVLIPDVVVVDVSKKESGESITSIDFHLPPEIKILDPEHEIYAIIKAIKAEIVEEPEEVKPAE
jgi:large subunit ribosomal protein L25